MNNEVYRVSVLIKSKEARNKLKFLKIDSKKRYPISEVDELLKFIQQEVKEKQFNVDIRFTLYDEVTIDQSDNKKKRPKIEKVQLGTFDYTIKPDTTFLSDNRFHQIAENEIYLNNPTTNPEYKKEVLNNILEASTIKRQNTVEKNEKKGKNKWFKNLFNKDDDDISESQNDNVEDNADAILEETDSLTEQIETETPSEGTESNTDAADDNNQDIYSNVEDDADNGVADDTQPIVSDVEKLNEEATQTSNTEKEEESQQTSDTDLNADIKEYIQIQDFDLPKVTRDDVFVKETTDPVENKRLSYLFHRETEKATIKEQALLSIYDDLLEKYQAYLVAEEEDVEAKLQEYEETREQFIESYLEPFKERASKAMKDRRAAVDDKQGKELEDFKEEQRRALENFETQLEIDKDNLLNAEKEEQNRLLKQASEDAYHQFEEKKQSKLDELKAAAQDNIKSYLLIDRQEHIKQLNEKVFNYDEATYASIDKKMEHWKLDAEDARRRQADSDAKAVEQAKLEDATKAKDLELQQLREKERQTQEETNRLKEQELKDQAEERAYRQEEQRLRAHENQVKEKSNEINENAVPQALHEILSGKYGSENDSNAKLSNKALGWIGAAALLLIIVVTTLAFSLFNGTSYAELVEEQNYVEAYEEYPDRLNDVIRQAYDDRDSESLEQLAEHDDTGLADLYMALIQNDASEVNRQYQSYDDKSNLDSDIQARVIDVYLSEQNIEQAKAVNQNLNDDEYAEKIANTQHYINIKEDLEKVIADSDNEDEVSDAERDLQQINTLLNQEAGD